MNMIQMYLGMNCCVLEGDNIYQVDPLDNTKKEYLGKLVDWKIDRSTMTVNIKTKKELNFININVELDNNEK